MRKQSSSIKLVVVLFLCTLTIGAQSKVKKFDYKKGEVLDILLFTGKKDFSKNFKKYRETAIALALQKGYQPQPLLSISETTKGGLQPETFVLGKWKNMKVRKEFLKEIEHKVPDFHEQRRALWSTFLLAFYEVKEDVSIEISDDKTYVVSAYWKKKSINFADFTTNFIATINKQGGKVLTKLTNAHTPVGYMYKPDFVIISEWKNKASFDAFSKEDINTFESSIINVNEFIVQ